MAAMNGEIIIKTERRPCLVNGVKALFHNWAETENVIFKIKCLISYHEIEQIIADYKKIGVIPKEFETEKIKTFVAIVEYEDGQIGEAQPSAVRFLDNEHINYAAFAEREATK